MTIKGGKCINQGAFYVSTAAIFLFTDLMVISIPIIITWRLQMPLRRKIAVCFILCLGGVCVSHFPHTNKTRDPTDPSNSATAIGVWRIIILAKAFFPTGPVEDPTFGIGFCSSAIEVNVAVITACAPSTKAIASRFLPRLLGTSRNGKSSYGPGTSGGSRGIRKSRFFHSSRKSSQLHSGNDGDGGYEMADPSRGNQVDVIGAEKGSFDMRKYRRGGDSPSISSGSLEPEGPAGIVKTTDVSVQYTHGSEDGRSRGDKSVSVDSLV